MTYSTRWKYYSENRADSYRIGISSRAFHFSRRSSPAEDPVEDNGCILPRVRRSIRLYTRIRVARVALVSFSRRSPDNSSRLTQCSLRGTTFANNTHVSTASAQKHRANRGAYVRTFSYPYVRMITKYNRLLLFRGEINWCVCTLLVARCTFIYDNGPLLASRTMSSVPFPSFHAPCVFLTFLLSHRSTFVCEIAFVLFPTLFFCMLLSARHTIP